MENIAIEKRAEIITLTPLELKQVVRETSEQTVNLALERFSIILAEQKEYYEQLYSAQEIAALLQCSLESVYRYWRVGKLGYGQIKPSEKGSSKAQIDDFRRNLAERRE